MSRRENCHRLTLLAALALVGCSSPRPQHDAGERCEAACKPAQSSADAGEANDAAGGRAAPRLTIRDFDDVEVDVSAAGEVTLPKLSTTIAGAGAQSLVGDWKAQGCDPPSGDARYPNCPELVITADASGVVSGFLQFSNGSLPQPFPPASHPDLGYPPGLELAAVNELHWNGASGVRYPLRDARFADGTLTFLWSPNDLFQDWCALQAPQRWTVEGRTFEFCGPQDPQALAALDPVKRSLCVSASLRPWCAEPDGSEQPCVCLESNPECTDAVCYCDRAGCEADTRSLASKASFVVDGDAMIGGWEPWTNVVTRASSFSMVRAPTAETSGVSGAHGPDAGDGTSGPKGDAEAGAPEVWVGELWSLQPILCDPDGAFPVSAAPAARSTRVVLLIDRESDPTAPTGRIRIGQAVQPTIPMPPPIDIDMALKEKRDFVPNDSPYWCATTYLADGGEYGLLDSRRSKERLQFSIAPAELWRAWCTSQGRMAPSCSDDPGCDLPDRLCPCGAGGCQPHVGVRVSLDFTISGDTMATIVQPLQTAQIRLQRVQ